MKTLCTIIFKGVPLALLLCAGATSWAQSSSLFSNPTQALKVEIRVSLKDLQDHAHESPELRKASPGQMIVTDPQGQRFAHYVDFRARGENRLKGCGLPPLKVFLDKKTTAVDSPLAGIKNMKLVLPCPDYTFRLKTYTGSERWVNRELVLYQWYNALSPYAFKVQRLELTWVDPNGVSILNRAMAFAIEPDGQVEKRFNKQLKEVEEEKQIGLAAIDGQQWNTLALFNYLIGNGDVEVTKSMVRNVKIFQRLDARYIPFLYDLDFANIVREWGFDPKDFYTPLHCQSTESEMSRVIANFIAKKAEIYAIIEQSYQNGIINRTEATYLKENGADPFYAVISRPNMAREFVRDFKGKCK